MAKTLWGHENDWPVDPIGFAFLLRATDQVGRAMFGDEWRRPSFDDPNDSSGPQFRRIIKMIAETCEAGDLPAAYRQGDGEMVNLEARDWHVKDWKYYFIDGDIEVPASYFEASHFESLERQHEPVVASWEKCPIFVRRKELDQFISGVATAPSPNKRRVRAAGPDVEKKVRAYIAALPGDRIVNEKQLWEWAKANLPRARREQVLAAKRAIVGNPGRGRIRKSNPQNQIPKK